MSSGNEPEKPIKNWTQYENFRLGDYISRNFDKADCSFIITDPTAKNDSKIELRSFKWILSDMSPVLEEILDDEKNRAKNFKSIPINDKNFQSLLSFAHTKSFLRRSFGYLMDLYESSRQYKSELLTNEIVSGFEKKDPTGNWIRFAIIFYRDFHSNERLREVFRKKWTQNQDRIKTFECELTSNIETVLYLDSNRVRLLFSFIYYYNISPALCFKTAEAYLLKHVFKGKTPDKIEEEDNLNIDVVNTFFKYIKFSEISIEDFNNGPAKSVLLDEAAKKYLCTLVRKGI